MTLYQRIYASGSTAQARRAWFVAGLFEWPVMAFMGVLLGLMALQAVGWLVLPLGLDPNVFGISLSALVFVALSRQG